MVEPKSKRWSYFAVFVVPCLALYILFFIVPFINGIGISLTNWDGLTQKVPNMMTKNEFELTILDKLKKQSDKDFLLSLYRLNKSDNTYYREAISGRTKYRAERILRKAKYAPEKYKFVGLGNYKKIFRGEVGQNFYPHRNRIEKFNKNSDLPSSIDKQIFEHEIMKSVRKKQNKRFISKQNMELFQSAYTYDEKTEKYRRTKEFDEFRITTPIYELPEVIETKIIPESRVDSFVREMKKYALEEDTSPVQTAVDAFVSEYNLSHDVQNKLTDISNELISIGIVKNLLADNWIVYQVNMGVVGFTIFFAVFSVIGINVLAFILALALDTGIKGQKFLRTIFFLPNVLSMIIVALIWNMLFVNLLPAITGVEKWLSDPNKAPWLLVLVAIWQGAGYYMIVYLAGLQNIPTEVIEAAKIDGTTGWQTLTNITLPLMVPSITISLFLTIANALKSFDLMYALVGSTGYATGTVPLVYDIYFQAYSQREAGMATAKAMILFVAIVLVTGIQLIIMKRKEVEA